MQESAVRIRPPARDLPISSDKVGGPGCRCHDHAVSSPEPCREGARLAPPGRIGDRSCGRRRRTHPRIWLPGLPGLRTSGTRVSTRCRFTS